MGGFLLHFFGCREAENVDAGLQNVFGKTDQGDITGFQFLVFFCENTGFVIELIHTACKLINVGADEIGGGGL